MKKLLAVFLAVMVLGMFSTVDVSAKKRFSAKVHTTKVKSHKNGKSRNGGSRVCPKCNGAGMIYPNLKCDGMGRTVYDKYAYGCKRCGGRGYAEVTDGMGAIKKEYGLVIGSGRVR